MKAISRVLIALVAAIAGLFASTGTSNAGLDNELSLLDGAGRTLTIQQWDTYPQRCVSARPQPADP